MECWTAYLLRAEDGSCWTMGDKWGDWFLLEEDDRVRIVESILRHGTAVGDDRARDHMDSWFCRGVVLDLVTRRHRFFGCDPKFPRPHVAYRESLTARLTSAPGWSGWDVGYAWGGHEDLVEIVPEARPVVAPPADLTDLEAVPLEDALTSRDDWFAGWDPGRREISVLFDETSADWFDPADAVVSVIGSDGTVLDYQLAVHHIMPFLARHGASLTAALSAVAPYPLPAEETVRAGVVVDVPARRLRHWTPDGVPPQLAAKVAAAWPGWLVERLPLGFVGHLAATGGDGQDLIVPDARLREDGWEEDLIAFRNRRRRALPADPRNLRRPRVRVIEET